MLEVNGEYVFRFPRYRETEKRLRSEMEPLPKLRRHLSTPLPDYKFVWKEDREHPLWFGGYPKLPGVAISTRTLALDRSPSTILCGSHSSLRKGKEARIARLRKELVEMAQTRIVLDGSVESSVARGLDLLSSTLWITVVVGFPFIASPESPCASETRGLFSAVNGRTSTIHSRL